MTVKSTVSFTDRHHEVARRKVEEGVFASVSSVTAAGLERMMQDEAEREAALEAMKETIKRRNPTYWLDFGFGLVRDIGGNLGTHDRATNSTNL